jgi:hypothetical protein
MTRDIDMLRTMLAFLLSPLPAPAIYYLSAIFLQDTGGEFTLGSFGMIYFLGLPLAYLVEMIVGVPLYLISASNHWKSISLYILGGSIAGVLLWLFISSLSDMGYYLVTLASLAIVGSVCGAIFHTILGRRRYLDGVGHDFG